ncbi:MAG: FAD-dependent oxidoreductase [Lachnospiraceae bacterium]|nr:FAD-dependent oxidoreductase [Lachnospiraceae bacterium]
MNSSQREFKYLFSPFKIGNVEIKNRMVFQSHVPYFATQDGYPTEATKRYYLERAKGGVGLIVIESMMVHPSGIYAPGCMCLWKEGIAEAFKDFPERVHQYGTKVFGQLSHPGANVFAKPHQMASAPSQVPDDEARVIPKELDIETIEEIIQGFAQSALLLKQTGFDGVELKFAHDGLLRAFVLPNLNRRTDKYGGDYEGRLTFFKELVQAIREKVGPDYPVGVRLCLDQFSEKGVTQEYGIKLAKSCERLGINYINGDSGGCVDCSMQIYPMYLPLGVGVYLASAVKKAVNIPVFACGRVNDPVLMEMILEEGHADMVGSARQFICDPETANKAMAGELDDVRHCIACNDGCLFQCMQGKPIRCVQNPATGREQELGIGTLQPAEEPKNIMVIGGGIAGMKFAEIAAKRKHKVTVYEKEEILGGQLNIAEKMPYRAEITEVSRYIRLQLDKYGVECHTNVNVDLGLVEKENPDVVVVATGSKAYVPEIKGDKNTRVKIMDVRYALTHPGEIGDNVVVFDKHGHIQGAGIVELPLSMGAKVHYFTPYEKIGADVDPATTELIRKRLFDYEDFEYQIHYTIEEVKENAVIMKHCYSQKQVVVENVDTLIYAHYSVSDTALYKELKKSRKQVYSVGDCNAPRLIEQTIYDSEILAREL